MDGNLTELGLLMGIPLELPREDIMDIAEDYNDTDREVGEIDHQVMMLLISVSPVSADNLFFSILRRCVAAVFTKRVYAHGSVAP